MSYLIEQKLMKILAIKLPPLPGKNKQNEQKLTSRKLPFAKCETNASTQNEETAQDSSESYTRIETSCNQVHNPSKKSVDMGRTLRIRDSFTSAKSSKKPQTSLEKVTFSQLPPKVTAKSWILYEMKEGRSIYGRRTHKPREIASLTKMINLVTILELLEKVNLNLKDVKVKASTVACTLQGTSADLRPFAEYSLHDLLYGMMLPSGNDAAFLIAQVGGYLLQNGVPSNWEKMSNTIENQKGYYVNVFMRQVNQKAQKIGMTNSHFANPHGLNNPQGYSCAEDLAKLCSYAMRNGKFRKVVQTKRFEYWYTESPKHEEEFLRSELDARVSLKSKGMWENTNKMLGSGWSGIKTGITPNAGPCLAACVDRYFAGKEYQFLVILLDSESMEARWEEAQNLVDWAILNRLYV